MKLNQLINFHQIIFHIFGQNLYNPMRYSNNRLYLAARYIPTLLMSFVFGAFYFCWTIAQASLFDIATDLTDAIIINVLGLTYLLSVISSIVQSYSQQNKFHHMLELIKCIEMNFLDKFNLQINCDKFVVKYLLQFIATILLYSMTVFMKFYFSTNITTWIELFYSFGRLMGVLINLYITFYISLLNSLMTLLKEVKFLVNKNELLSSCYYMTTTCECFCKMLCNYKILHFKISLVSIYMNDVFGWTLVATTIRTFIEMSYTSFWVYFYLQRDVREHVFVLRKYGFFLLNILYIMLVLS